MRKVCFSKAFVVGYSESYSNYSGNGTFAIYLRQLLGKEIECIGQTSKPLSKIEQESMDAQEEMAEAVQEQEVIVENALKTGSTRKAVMSFTDRISTGVSEDVKGGLESVIKNGKIKIDDIKANPDVFSGKSVDEIAQMLKDSGYDVTVQASQRSSSGAKIIKINNPGGGKNITQVQVSPGGGRHGANPYVKISTSDQGIIKIVDGAEDIYKTDGKENSTIIFTGGK